MKWTMILISTMISIPANLGLFFEGRASASPLKSTLQGQQTATSVSAQFASAHVFRGQTKNKGAVLQPAATILAESGFEGGVWGNVDLNNNAGRSQSGQFSQIDMHLSYAPPIPTSWAWARFGVREYTYPSTRVESPDDASSDREFQASVGIDGLLSPRVAVNYGILGAVRRQIYTEVSLRQTLVTRSSLHSEIEVLAGHYNYNETELEDGWSHVRAGWYLRYKGLYASLHQLIETNRSINDLKGQATRYGMLGIHWLL